MRVPILACVAALLLTGCMGTTEAWMTNAAVDADPMCVSRPDRPGEPVSRDCERNSGLRMSSERPSTPIDFRKREDD